MNDMKYNYQMERCLSDDEFAPEMEDMQFVQQKQKAKKLMRKKKK